MFHSGDHHGIQSFIMKQEALHLHVESHLTCEESSNVGPKLAHFSKGNLVCDEPSFKPIPNGS